MAPVSLAERVFETIRPVSAAPATHANPNESRANGNSDASIPKRNTLRRNASDDEILGLGSGSSDSTNPSLDGQLSFDFEAAASKRRHPDEHSDEAPLFVSTEDRGASKNDPDNLQAALDANPELRQDREDARAYREAFATPEEACAATRLLADLDRLDTLFFSLRPEDHAELARSIASLNPAAFESLRKAMDAHGAVGHPRGTQPPVPQQNVGIPATQPAENPSAPISAGSTAPGRAQSHSALTPAQESFFHATNAAAVESVIDAIETQVEKLLPEGVSKNARNRVVGEIYRELDNTLSSNRQLAGQMREAFRSGSLDTQHQRAIVSLIAGRARQALPGVAKRVLSEWTSTVVAASHDRRARQRAAERRVDIAGSSGGGNESRRPTSPRDIDYARMSDGDILNL